MDEPVVWIIDSDQWPRACLRAELIERGYDAVGFATLRAALIELALPRAPRPHLIVLDLRDQPHEPRQLEALARSGAPLVAIAGAAEASNDRLRGFGWTAFLRRPVTLGAVADLVDRLLAPRPGAHPHP
jgi:DNA-binding response OmpR family regulator